MLRVTNARDLDGAWLRLRASLARWLANSFPATTRSFLEVGCGSGQITLPLAEINPERSITAVDSFRGPYSRNRAKLEARLRRTGLHERVRVVRANALRWISTQEASTFDVVLSSEFLPELTSKEMSEFYRSCYRVLRRGGRTLHLFLTPNATNPRQRLVIEADSDPRWTRHPPTEWFSPEPRLAQRALMTAGFEAVRCEIRKGGLAFTGAAARAQLRRWGVGPAFARTYERRLNEDGLELPDWVIVVGTKP